MKRLLLLALLFFGLTAPASAFYQSRDSNYNVNVTSGGGGGGCSDSATFLARGTFDAGHTSDYQDFICGLNTDGIGIFTNAWDVLVILGTQNVTVAALNLPSTSFSPTANGAPTFTTDLGYTGVDGSTTVYLDTNYNPNTQGTNFTQNSAHASIWVVNNVLSGVSGGACTSSTSAGTGTRIFPRYNDGNSYSDANASSNNTLSFVPGTSFGHYLANRTGSTASQLYFNGSSVATSSVGSVTVPSSNFVVLASDSLGVITFGCGNTIAAYSYGRGLTPTEASNFASRMRTLGTALGWP